ncbi:MAG: hypothetical protein Rubg2KO_06990 [Rubricoccaceae bacterium]
MGDPTRPLVFFASLIGLVLACAAFLVVLRSWRRQRERDTWSALAVRFPASDRAYEGTRFVYPNATGEVIVGEDGFRASPSPELLPIDVPWSEVRSVKAGVGGGLRVHVRGGVVMLPGRASATVAQIIQRRAQRRRQAPA